MNSVRSTDHASAAAGSRLGRNAESSLPFSASKIRTTPGVIANSARRQRCANCWNGKSTSKMGNAESVNNRLPTAGMLSPTTGSPKAWERPGEMTTRTIFRRHIGGATSRRGQKDCIPIKSPDSSITPHHLPAFGHPGEEHRNSKAGVHCLCKRTHIRRPSAGGRFNLFSNCTDDFPQLKHTGRTQFVSGKETVP